MQENLRSCSLTEKNPHDGHRLQYLRVALRLNVANPGQNLAEERKCFRERPSKICGVSENGRLDLAARSCAYLERDDSGSHKVAHNARADRSQAALVHQDLV